MYKKCLVVILVSLAILSTLIQPFTPVYAEGEGPECWAVLVGISDYQQIDDLEAPTEDTKELFNLLNPAWGKTHLKLLLNKEATYAGIQAAISWLASSADADDTVLFYFAGHGNEEYIATYNAYYESTWISSLTLKNWLSKIRSKRVAIILDTCHAASLSNEISGSGRVILFSSRADESAWEGSFPAGWHAFFTYYLLEALSKFSIADVNGDYELSAEEVFQYASSRTLSWSTERYNRGKITNIQHPVSPTSIPVNLAYL